MDGSQITRGATAPFYLPRGDEVAVFEAAAAHRLPVLLNGPTGCGKTRFVAHMAAKLGRPLYTVACHDDRSAADLIGRRLLPASSSTAPSQSTGGCPSTAPSVPRHPVGHHRRRKADQADRTDSFILHKFEAILSMTEFLNLNRRVEDDDEGTARKAADDQDEIGLAQVSKAPATRLKLHLVIE